MTIPHNTTSASQQRPFHSRKRQRGSSLVEFGLILPAFLLITCGIIDFGRAIWAYNTIANSAREGARYAMIRGGTSRYPATVSQIKTVIGDYSTGLKANDMVVTISWLPDNQPGSQVQVQVQYTFRPVTPLVDTDPLELTSSSRMVISN